MRSASPDSTFWSPAVALLQTDFIDVSFKAPVVPSHVIVIDNDEGNGVTGVDVWVNGSFVSVFEGNVSGSGFVGAEVYALTKPIDLPVNRVRVRFLGYRLHRIEAIRLVGRLVSSVPRVVPSGPRLPGVFKKTVIPLASSTIGRFDAGAEQSGGGGRRLCLRAAGLAFDPEPLAAQHGDILAIDRPLRYAQQSVHQLHGVVSVRREVLAAGRGGARVCRHAHLCVWPRSRGRVVSIAASATSSFAPRRRRAGSDCR
jgi:hypothetical protein